MRVKLCARCPYSPQDLADYYDESSSFHLCIRCDGRTAPKELTILTTTDGESQCAIAKNALNAMAQATPALSVADSLA